MKLTSYLARFAAATFTAFALAVAFDFAALPLFCIAAAASVLLAVVGDYSPRPAPCFATIAVVAARREAMPLAA